MHSSKSIKICKVESKSFAKYALMKGADYLGVHVIDFLLDKEVAELCTYISIKGGRCILLTKVRDIKKLKQLADFYKPWAIQLHYQIDAEKKLSIESRLKLPIISVFTDNTDERTVNDLINCSDLVVYDTSFQGGTGLTHSRRQLNKLTSSQLAKILLAGGVTPDLIESLANTPLGGFDVQSFCRENGRHHYGRTKQILDAVKGSEERQISISLTDVVDISHIPKYPDIQSLEYQVDFSEGNLYKDFKVNTLRIKNIVSEADAPITLHIFETGVKEFQRVIDDFVGIANNNIVRINIQYSPGLKIEDINTYHATLCASIYYKDISSYIKQYPTPHACLSIILPSELSRKIDTLKEYGDFINYFQDCEIWFDRRVDIETARVVLNVSPQSNFIVGEYVLDDWSREIELNRELGNV